MIACDAWNANAFSDEDAMPEPLVRHCKKEQYDVYIGRSRNGGNHYGNPFTFKGGTLADKILGFDDDCIIAYEEWLIGTRFTWLDQRRRAWILRQLVDGKLTGKRLGCYCSPGRCHGDVLAYFARNIRGLPGLLDNLRILEQELAAGHDSEYN